MNEPVSNKDIKSKQLNAMIQLFFIQASIFCYVWISNTHMKFDANRCECLDLVSFEMMVFSLLIFDIFNDNFADYFIPRQMA